MAVIGVVDVARAFRAAARPWPPRREAVVARRDAQLRRLVAHAYANVPYYRALFRRHGVEPAQVRTAADLTRLPITSRRDLQAAAPGSLLAQGVDPARLLVHRTSGSTGEPIEVRRTWLEERVTTAFRLRALRDVGLRALDTLVHVGMPRRPDPQNGERLQSLMRALGWYRKVQLDRRLPPAELLRQLEALRPGMISGGPGALARLAATLAQHRSWVVRPRLVISGGDLLTPTARRLIAASFGAPVFDLYGAIELGFIGWECPRAGGFHVADDGVVLEILRDGRPAAPGEVGEVVATQLYAFAAPFIRYRLGDLATRGDTPCPCGAPFSTIREIQGRMGDHLELANGRLVLASDVGRLIAEDPRPWVAQYQLTPESRNRVVIHLEPLVPPPRGAVEALARRMRDHLGPEIELEMLVVPEIPLTADGKLRVARPRPTPTGDPMAAEPDPSARPS